VTIISLLTPLFVISRCWLIDFGAQLFYPAGPINDPGDFLALSSNFMVLLAEQHISCLFPVALRQ